EIHGSTSSWPGLHSSASWQPLATQRMLFGPHRLLLNPKTHPGTAQKSSFGSPSRPPSFSFSLEQFSPTATVAGPPSSNEFSTGKYSSSSSLTRFGPPFNKLFFNSTSSADCSHFFQKTSPSGPSSSPASAFHYSICLTYGPC